jgi:hypothetical protein
MQSRHLFQCANRSLAAEKVAVILRPELVAPVEPE